MFSLDLETHLWERMYFQVWIKRSVLPDIFRILAFSTRTSRGGSGNHTVVCRGR